MILQAISIARKTLLLLLFFTVVPVIGFAQQEPGEDAFMSYLIAEKQLRQDFEAYLRENQTTVFSLPEGHFNHKLDSLRKISTKRLQIFLQEQKFTEKAISDRMALDIRFFYDKYRLDYLLYHACNDSKRKPLGKELKANSKYFGDASMLGIESFTNYLYAFVDLESFYERRKRKYKMTDNQLLAASLAVIEKHFTNPVIKEYLQQHYLLNHIEQFGIKNIYPFFKTFTETSSNAVFVNRLMAAYSEDENIRSGHLIRGYKHVHGIALDIHIFLPSQENDTAFLPAVVFFHGGGWAYGKPDWHFEECRILAANGFVGVVVEYRLADRHGSTPFEAVKDAKSAIRWLRIHAGEFGINPNKIIASGNSAGGQLAIAAALTADWNEATDDLSISAVPNAIMVNAAVYDMTHASKRVKCALRENRINESLLAEISPLHIVKAGLPPMLVIHGNADKSVPWQSALEFVNYAKDLGNTIDFQLLDDGGHFLWWGKYAELIEQIRAKFLKATISDIK